MREVILSKDHVLTRAYERLGAAIVGSRSSPSSSRPAISLANLGLLTCIWVRLDVLVVVAVLLSV